MQLINVVIAEEVDCRGTHELSCRHSEGRLYRHGSINSIIHRALTSAKISSRLEPEGLSRTDGKQPDACLLFPGLLAICLSGMPPVPTPLQLHITVRQLRRQGKLPPLQRIERPTNISTWIQPTFLSHLHLRPWVFSAPRHWPV